MDFVTFKQAAKLLPENISVIMRGRHGIGKTEVVRQLAVEEFSLPIIERRLSQLTEGDLIGLPKIDGNTTRFLPPDWYQDAMEKPCLLFLDEFDRSIHEVQQAAMELILDRSIQGKKIHDDCRIYAAINGGKHGAMYNVNNIDPALNDRFWIADIDPSAQEWLAWGQDKIISEILDFIHIHHEEHLETKKLTQDAYKITPSRRSWTRLSNVLRNNPDVLENFKKQHRLFVSLCTGFVGIEAAGKFLSFLKDRNKHVTAEDILDRFDQNESRLKAFKVEQLNLAIDKIAQHSMDPKKPIWTKVQVKNVYKFFEILSSELKMTMWDKVTVTGAKIENAQTLGKLVSDLIIEILE